MLASSKQRSVLPVAVIAIARVSAASAVTSTVPTATAVTRVAAAIATAGSHLFGRLPAILGKHHGQLTTVHLVPVEVVHGISGIAAIVELDEGEPTGALRVVILG
jgi:hypothetical protein